MKAPIPFIKRRSGFYALVGEIWGEKGRLREDRGLGWEKGGRGFFLFGGRGRGGVVQKNLSDHKPEQEKNSGSSIFFFTFEIFSLIFRGFTNS